MPQEPKRATLVKICGTTTVADARLAMDAGADFVGGILEHPASPRSISIQTALAIRQVTQKRLVVVTVNLSLQRLLELHSKLQPHALQLHGDEPLEVVAALAREGIGVWAVAAGASHEAALARAEQLIAAGAASILVDQRMQVQGKTVYGGTGQVGDWDLAGGLVARGLQVILAGGLNPSNVRQAIEHVQPFAVDGVSGLEAAPGRKDPAKVRDFVLAARSAA